MEPKPSNAIDFEEVSKQEAFAAGSPAEQQKVSPETLDAKFTVAPVAEPKTEDTVRAQEIMDSLQASPEKSVEQPTPNTNQEKTSSITPAQFMKNWGGKNSVAGYAVEPSEKGAAQFLESRRLDTPGKIAMLGGAAAAGALTYLGLPILAEAGGLSAVLVSAGTLTTAIGVGVPLVCAGTALYFAGKGIRNFMAERSFKKTFGKSVDQTVTA